MIPLPDAVKDVNRVFVQTVAQLGINKAASASVCDTSVKHVLGFHRVV